jgi:hypothetical protein
MGEGRSQGGAAGRQLGHRAPQRILQHRLFYDGPSLDAEGKAIDCDF